MNEMTVHKIDPPIVLKNDESFEFSATYPLSADEKVILKKELERKFKCRICGHEKCEYRFNTDSYVCCGCSAMFEHPEKFTEKHVGWETRDPRLGD